MIQKAIDLANKAHSGQMRKGSNVPYILHPMEATTIVHSIIKQMNNFYDEELLTATMLHDILEDTETTEEYLMKEFPERVVYLVKSQSENKEKSWKERKQHTIDYLNNTQDWSVKIICLADKLSNIRDIARDYKQLDEVLWERFNEKRKSEHGWYYKSLLASFEVLKFTDAYSEFSKLVNSVFSE